MWRKLLLSISNFNQLNKAYKIALFFLLIFSIDRTLGYFIEHFSIKYPFDKRIELIINGELNKEILILGSSRALNGIDPETIKKQTNKSCYNLAYSGSNVEFHETILDLLIYFGQKPKTLIYNLDDPATLVEQKDLIIYKLEELYPFVYNDFINEIVCNKIDKSIFATNMSWSYRQNVNFIKALKYLFTGKEIPNKEINNINSYGANLMDGVQSGFENMEFKNQMLSYSKYKEHQPNVKSFLRIVEKCESNNIELILTISPSFFSKNIGFKNRIEQLTNFNYKINDYSDVFRDKNLFYNHGHLNKNGAVEFSELLSNDLLKNLK